MASYGAEDGLRRRVPRGRDLPARFDEFLKARPPCEVGWTDLKDRGLKPRAMREAVPFLRLGDGGLVVLWYHAESPAVVHIGGHSERRVIARDFDDFLRGINSRRSGLPDFDEADDASIVPGMLGEPETEGLPALQEKFDAWCKKHSALQVPFVRPDSEALRRRLHRIAREMIRDGWSKTYSLSSPWWSMDYRIERTDTELAISYLDYGEWSPVPAESAAEYGLDREVKKLLELVKHKRRSRYDLSVCEPGIVSVDRDRELVLVPPERQPRSSATG
jgi:hypothetical protein